jgi:hypothetical protein
MTKGTVGRLKIPAYNNNALLQVEKGSNSWHVSPYHTGPVGNPWPIINRAYYTPFFFPEETIVTAIALNVTSASAVGNTLRLCFSKNSIQKNRVSPGKVLDQVGGIAHDVTGIKTFVFNSPKKVQGLYWAGACPQGVGAPGSIHMGALYYGSLPSRDTSAGWLGSSSPYAYENLSGNFIDDPIVTWESSPRAPWIGIKIQ